MTRGQQTAWIIGAMIVAVVVLITAFVVMENKKKYDERYPGCWQLVGTDLACEANVVANRIRDEHY